MSNGLTCVVGKGMDVAGMQGQLEPETTCSSVFCFYLVPFSQIVLFHFGGFIATGSIAPMSHITYCCPQRGKELRWVGLGWVLNPGLTSICTGLVGGWGGARWHSTDRTVGTPSSVPGWFLEKRRKTKKWLIHKYIQWGLDFGKCCRKGTIGIKVH